MKGWLSSLTNRIFLSSALLTVLALGVAIFVVNVMVTAQVERELQRGLEEAGAWVEQYRSMLVGNLEQQARLIADLPKFKAAVATNHVPTAQQSAADYRRQIAADLFVVTNAHGTVLASDGQVPSDLLLRLGREDSQPVAPLIWPRGDGLLQVVVVPIWIDPAAPELLGHLAVGAALDTALAERIKSLSDADVAFFANGEIVASTLPQAATQSLADLRLHPLTGGIRVGSQEYVGQVRNLRGTDVTEPAVIILRSRTERQRLLRSLHTAIAGTAAVAILLATLLSYAVARTITRPLGAITAALRETAATGDLTRKFKMPADVRLLDEDARVLVSTLDAMTASIARFQREASQRERLSSLGRLSTVIAHEIRNPLMIIKTALRTLRREDATHERLRQAAHDIDGEVDRLNRLVNDVLDFARPMRFDLAPASLSAICQGAVAAAFMDASDVPCQVTLDEAADEIVTDAERLRQALLNLLVNARQAVLAKAPTEAAVATRESANVLHFRAAAEPAAVNGAAVQLATCAVNEDRVHILVRDTGAGISTDLMPRVFEPYFTTRRTGSGLGLAITRNIVEGLGGTITIDSETGLGTEIRLDLPRAPRLLPSTANGGSA